MPLTVPPAGASFLGAPVVTDLDGLAADYAVIGIPHGVPYDPEGPVTTAALAPRAVRERSERYGAFREHHDFDTGGPLLPPGVRVVDVGDVPTDPADPAGNRERASRAVAALLARGVVPVVLGGDDSTPPFALAAYAGHRPVTVVQVDAHVDYRDEVGGERHGYSSPMRPCVLGAYAGHRPGTGVQVGAHVDYRGEVGGERHGYSSRMRRAAEMPWVERVVHVGIRGVGSARREDVEATLARGNAIVTAREVHERGAAAALERVPEGGRYYLAVDVDGFDPSVVPGTAALAPGGL